MGSLGISQESLMQLGCAAMELANALISPLFFQGGNGRRIASILEQQFQFMSSPQTSPHNEPLLNNNNNISIPSLHNVNNNNKEAKGPFPPQAHPHGGGKSPERQSGAQRRNHQGHFVSPAGETSYGGQNYSQGGGGGKERNKSPPSNHSSPSIHDRKSNSVKIKSNHLKMTPKPVVFTTEGKRSPNFIKLGRKMKLFQMLRNWLLLV